MSGADYNIGVASPILIPYDCNWHLATITSDRHSIFGGRIYLDGQVVRTFVDLEDSMKNQASLFIGAAHYSSDGLTSDSFLGGIDELMILKSVLSAEQISSYYRALRAQAQDAGPC